MALKIKDCSWRLNRMSSAIGKDISYKLGHGGTNPAGATPDVTLSGKRTFGCDCSGGIAWASFLQRRPKKSRPFWIETTNIYRDATSGNPKSTFVKISKPVPGCYVVYGDYRDARGRLRQGHIAIYGGTGKHGKGIWGVDCSVGGKGFKERNLQFFLSKKSIYCVLRQDLA